MLFIHYHMDVLEVDYDAIHQIILTKNVNKGKKIQNKCELCVLYNMGSTHRACWYFMLAFSSCLLPSNNTLREVYNAGARAEGAEQTNTPRGGERKDRCIESCWVMCFFFIAVHTVGWERRKEGCAAERERERGRAVRCVSVKIKSFHTGVNQNRARLYCTYGNVAHKVQPWEYL